MNEMRQSVNLAKERKPLENMTVDFEVKADDIAGIFGAIHERLESDDMKIPTDLGVGWVVTQVLVSESVYNAYSNYVRCMFVASVRARLLIKH